MKCPRCNGEGFVNLVESNNNTWIIKEPCYLCRGKEYDWLSYIFSETQTKLPFKKPYNKEFNYYLDLLRDKYPSRTNSMFVHYRLTNSQKNNIIRRKK